MWCEMKPSVTLNPLRQDENAADPNAQPVPDGDDVSEHMAAVDEAHLPPPTSAKRRRRSEQLHGEQKERTPEELETEEAGGPRTRRQTRMTALRAQHGMRPSASTPSGCSAQASPSAGSSGSEEGKGEDEPEFEDAEETMADADAEPSHVSAEEEAEGEAEEVEEQQQANPYPQAQRVWAVNCQRGLEDIFARMSVQQARAATAVPVSGPCPMGHGRGAGHSSLAVHPKTHRLSSSPILQLHDLIDEECDHRYWRYLKGSGGGRTEYKEHRRWVPVAAPQPGGELAPCRLLTCTTCIRPQFCPVLP